MESDRRALWTALWTDADGDGTSDGTSPADSAPSASTIDASTASAGASTATFSSFGDAPPSALGGRGGSSARGAARPGRRGGPGSAPGSAGAAAAAAARRGVFGVSGARPGRGPKNVFSLAAQHAHQTRPAMPLASAWLNGALLGRWDNVTGPRVELSWRCERRPSASDTDILHATRDTQEEEREGQSSASTTSEDATTGTTSSNSNEETITHHVMAGTLEDSLAVKMVVLPHMDSVLCSVAFACEMPDDAPGFPSRLTFALHAGHAHLARIVAAFPVIEEKLLYVATLVRAVAAPSPRQQREQTLCLESLARRGVAPPGAPETVDMLSTEIVHVLRSLDAVVTCPGLLTAPLGNGGGDDGDGSVAAPDTIGVRDTEDFGRKLYGATSVFGVDFVSRVLTAHLRTRGHTVVVARDAFVANVLVDVLAPFLAPRDRLLSRHAAPPSDHEDEDNSSDESNGSTRMQCRCHALYHPDLVLQAVVVPPAVSRAAAAAAASGRRSRRRARVSLGLQLVDTELLVQAPLPVTVVDLTGCDAADDAGASSGAGSEQDAGSDADYGAVSPHASLSSIGSSAGGGGGGAGGGGAGGEHAHEPGVYQPASVAAFNTARANYFKYRMCHLPEIVVRTTAPPPQTPQQPAQPQPASPRQPGPDAAADSVREYPWLAQATPPLSPTSPSSSVGGAGGGGAGGAGGAGRAGGAAMALSQGSEPFLVPVTEPSRLVHDALCEALGLPAMLRLPYLLSVDRLLLLKAVTLLKLVQSDVESNHGSTEGTGKWLRDNLGLDNDADLNVVFAYAEKICPGIGASMMADRLTLEEKFIELFEGFV